jgi:hypothetical protein
LKDEKKSAPPTIKMIPIPKSPILRANESVRMNYTSGIAHSH